MRRLKILMCPVFYLPNRVGGIEVYVHALAKQLLAKGHIVKVLVADYPREKPFEAFYDGVPVITYPGFENITREEFKGMVPGKGLAGFISCLEKENPDIVHFHQITNSNGISIFHIEAAKKLGIRVVYTNHLAGFTCHTGKMMYRGDQTCDGRIDESKCAVCELQRHHFSEPVAKAIVQTGKLATSVIPAIGSMKGKFFSLLSYHDLIREKKETVMRVLQQVDAFIVLADWYYKVLELNGLINPKISIIRQGLLAPMQTKGAFQTKESFQTREALQTNGSVQTDGSFLKDDPDNPNVFRLIFIGRVSREKGLLILLKALQDLDEDKIFLNIYGHLDDLKYMEECKPYMEGRKNIKWNGLIENKDITEAISRHDALVLPSIVAEMAPLVIQEAFAANVPVIGTAIGGIADEIKNGENGYLFEMGDSTALHNLLKGILSSGSFHIPHRQLTPRSFESVAGATEEVYFSILNY